MEEVIYRIDGKEVSAYEYEKSLLNLKQARRKLLKPTPPEGKE